MGHGGLFSKKLTKEEKLERDGKMYELQKYRCEQRQREKIPKLLLMELRLEEIAQRKSLLEEEIDQVPIPTERSEKMEKELRDLEEEYFLKKCEWNQLYEKIDGPPKRALELWRSYPQWHLHRTFTKDCSDREGCCGRSCGCCQVRKAQNPRRFGTGHCSLECGCCQKARGFELSEEGKNKIRKLYAVDHEKNWPQYRKIMLASIYGLVDGKTESPFDLIDQPPEYKEN